MEISSEIGFGTSDDPGCGDARFVAKRNVAPVPVVLGAMTHRPITDVQ